MKQSDVFVGSILKVNNAEEYNKYGNTSNNETNYVELYQALAVLVKTRGEKYVWIMDVDSLIKDILFDLGIPLNTMNTIATMDGELIVDEESLVPYYSERELRKNKHVLARNLILETLLDPRLPGGIEYGDF